MHLNIYSRDAGFFGETCMHLLLHYYKNNISEIVVHSEFNTEVIITANAKPAFIYVTRWGTLSQKD